MPPVSYCAYLTRILTQGLPGTAGGLWMPRGRRTPRSCDILNQSEENPRKAVLVMQLQTQFLSLPKIDSGSGTKQTWKFTLVVDGRGIFRHCCSQIIMMYHTRGIPWTNALSVIINLSVKPPMLRKQSVSINFICQMSYKVQYQWNVMLPVPSVSALQRA